MQPMIDFDQPRTSQLAEHLRYVPSWSWMANHGSISYVAVPGNSFAADPNTRMELPDGIESATWRLFGPLKRLAARFHINSSRGRTSYEIGDESDNMVGWVRYDHEEEEMDVGRIVCLSVGTGAPDWITNQARAVSYVLLLKRTPLPSTSGGDTYRRLGLAAIQCEYLSSDVALGEGHVAVLHASDAKRAIRKIELTVTMIAQYSVSPPARLTKVQTWSPQFTQDGRSNAPERALTMANALSKTDKN
ncbi:hypothetical protein MAPG_09612 [Magnaporthiopsis poae ATCC 64411]|uniref:Uncharacterized protein n=1 Tax=Magnaporthiopsis poae (strain ATCC 64411 / 73-15) TaxID=644358 RepID=A0A0C4EAE3_MAGP6|nr:hypothetical protein MAPG_09612 [Magnaporthiopsis poae ATCC 64411]